MIAISLLLAALLAGGFCGMRHSIHPPAPTPLSLPDAPGASTMPDLSRQTAASISRHLKKACPRRGIPDSSIEPQLFAFFDAFANLYAQLPGHPSAPELMQMADTLRATPCDDPGLLFCQGFMLQDSGRHSQALSLLLQAAALFDASDAPPLLKTCNAIGIVYSLDRLKKNHPDEQRSIWKSRAREHAAQTIAQNQLLPEDQRPLFELIREFGGAIFDERAENGRRLLVTRIEELGGGETWLGHLLAGRDHHARGWEFRGSGFANTVSREGWKGFHDELALAIPHLKAAATLQPAFPEPFEILLSITGEGLYDGPETLDDWFRQAVSAQIDYWPAYSSLLWFSQPRWTGSAQRVIDILHMVSECARYDTEVPDYTLRLFKTAAADQACFPQPYAAIGYGNLWRDPRCWELFRRVYDGYLRHEGDIPFERPVLARNYLDSALQFNQPQEFLRIAEEYRDSGLLDPATFARVRGYPIPLGAAKARLQLDHPRLRSSFLQALKKSDFPKAETLLRELDAAAPDARAYLQLPRRALHVRSQLEPESDWRDLVATPAFRTWTKCRGSWRAALDGAFLGLGDSYPDMLLLHYSPQGACEIAADVEIIDSPKTDPPNAAVVLALNSSSFVALSLYPAANEVRLSLGKNLLLHSAPLPPAPDASPRRLRLRFQNGAFDAWVDGVPCFVGQRFPQFAASARVRPGLAAFYRSKNASCLFRNVRSRSLSPETPAPSP